MKLYLDTANIEEIRKGAKLGVVSGVTTNPSLVAKEGKGGLEEYRRVAVEIGNILAGAGVNEPSVSAEVVAADAAGMIQQGREIARWSKHIFVKLPSTTAGFEATAALSREGVRVNQTLCFSVNQAILAALAGAAYVSPFIGRLDDISEDGIALVRDICEVYKSQGHKTLVLAASIRHPLHVVQAAKAGAHIASVPHKVLEQMIAHPLTDIGMARFMADWEKVSKPQAR
ncbi:MAG: fructose-6-phosphate aldolase [Chloroflexi bacterium]|nr:fructose-6-phosphate aldolase [Chloroflexota bacterium]